jgi:uncharacterized protein with PIN domain
MIIDSSALVAILRGEAEQARFAEIIARAEESGTRTAFLLPPAALTPTRQ